MNPTVFERAASILAEAPVERASRGWNEHGFLLRGLVSCRACGARMVPHFSYARRRSYRYYRCRSVLDQGKRACPVRSVSAAVLEDFVLARLRDVASHPRLVDAVVEQVVQVRDRERAALAAEEARLRDDQRTCRAEAQRLLAALAASNGEGASLAAEHLRSLDSRAARVERRLREVAATLAATDGAAVAPDDVRRILHGFDDLWNRLDTRERARAVHLLLSEIAYDGESGHIDLTFHSGGLAELSRRQKEQRA